MKNLVIISIILFASATNSIAQESDTIYHYYVNNSVSVKISPWENGRRMIMLYNLYGEKTFEMEEVRLSYSVSVNLKFAQNGSVSHIHSHMNPGASMYWYETEIEFSTTNEPLWKKSVQMPMQTIEDAMGDVYYWDKKKNDWQKQEVINCDHYRE
ncbi:MAG: hypothetical protein JXR36_02940 [Bacteroidales bacterium]|nr:hypothetical protein [Bacteroidales bacterium]